MEISKSQLSYIWSIKQLSGSKSSQKDICEYLNVKKSSASVALRNLEENGYILKVNIKGENKYTLSDKGIKIIEEIEKERLEFMSVFRDLLGINNDLCVKEYNRLYGCFSQEFISNLSKLHEKNYNNTFVPDNKNNFFNNGTYELPFEIVYYNSNEYGAVPSMGNKGFEYPALLFVCDEQTHILFKSKEIQYVSKNGNRLKGCLQKLYYIDNSMKWTECKKENENIWIIPFCNILYQKDILGNLSLGTIKIKAKATTDKMPESTAEVTFNFKLIKKIS